MDRKKIGIIIIVLGVLLLSGIVYMIFFYGNDNNGDLTQTATTTENKIALEVPAVAKVNDARTVVAAPKKLTKQQLTQEDLKRMAYLFAERFGSYSNQSTFRNLLDLKLFMTESMQVWADDYVAKQIAQKRDTSVYYGITTKSVTSKVIKFDEPGKYAEILIGTQRRESSEATTTVSSYGQEITVKFVKDGDDWLVNEARWIDGKIR